MAKIGPADPLGNVQLLGGRQAGLVKPRLAVKANGIDHESIAVPTADRISKPERIWILAMGTAVRKYLPPDVCATLIYDGREAGSLHNAERIRRGGHARHAGRQAAGFGIFARFTTFAL